MYPYNITRRECREAVQAALDADSEFDKALMVEGFQSRWHRGRDEGGATLQAAYQAKLDADVKMHEAFEAYREENRA